MGNNNHDKDQHQGKMSVQQAGEKGGEATAKTHGHDFYQNIGREGGEAPHEKRGNHGEGEK